jgi:ribosomal protein S18 acetylase RimI-like enzyme
MESIREKVSIRYLQKSDINNILELLKKTKLFFEPCDANEAYERMLKHSPQSVLVMTYEGSIIGMVIILYSPFVSVLYHGCIDPEYQRQGLGTILMLEAEKVIKRLGGTKAIAGYVEEGNIASLSMCRKIGYETYPTSIVCVYKASRFSQ